MYIHQHSILVQHKQNTLSLYCCMKYEFVKMPRILCAQCCGKNLIIIMVMHYFSRTHTYIDCTKIYKSDKIYVISYSFYYVTVSSIYIK